MKFDIARAWKDENYRQSLSDEQLSALPANPAGELTEADLASVSGGWDGLGLLGGGLFAQIRKESLAVLCELNVFSVNVLLANVAIVGSATQVCAKG